MGGDVSYMPHEYQAGALRWVSRAVHDLSLELHPVLSSMARSSVSELPNAVEGPDASELASPLHQVIKVSHDLTVSLNEVLQFDYDEVLAQLYDLADSYGGQLVRAVFQHIDEVCEQNGQVVAAEGRDIFDVLSDALEKIDFEFNDDGTHNVQLVMGSAAAAKFVGRVPTPEQEARANRVLEEKREEWHASRIRRELP